MYMLGRRMERAQSGTWNWKNFQISFSDRSGTSTYSLSISGSVNRGHSVYVDGKLEQKVVLKVVGAHKTVQWMHSSPTNRQKYGTYVCSWPHWATCFAELQEHLSFGKVAVIICGNFVKLWFFLSKWDSFPKRPSSVTSTQAVEQWTCSISPHHEALKRGHSLFVLTVKFT